MILFRPYEEYVDEIIGRHMINAVNVSMTYILNELDNRLNHNAPVFKINLELQIPDLVFIPALDMENSKTGLMVIIQNLIVDIYNMTDKIPRVAQPPIEERMERTEEEETEIIYEATYECECPNFNLIQGHLQ